MERACPARCNNSPKLSLRGRCSRSRKLSECRASRRPPPDRRSVRLARHHLVNALERNDAHDGTENFLLRDLHPVPDVREGGWLDEIAAIADTIAAAHQLRAFTAAGFDESHNLVELR